MKKPLALIGWGLLFVLALYAIHRVYAFGEVWLCVNNLVHTPITLPVPRDQVWEWCRDLHGNWPWSFFSSK